MTLDDLIKNKDSYPYRQGVIGLVVNDKNQILIVQMVDYQDNEWRLPGGGVDQGETHRAALLRELQEELGSSDFEVVSESKHKTKYDWPDKFIIMRFEKKGEKYKGQEQSQFLVKYKGNKALTPDPKELKNIKWVSIEDLPKYFIFPGQWEITKRVIDELIS